jgi:hypothetical protein
MLTNVLLFLEDPLGKLPRHHSYILFLNNGLLCAVPSIATEYVRNRIQHDHTARRWTELYARPPAFASAIPSSGSFTLSPAPPVSVPISTSTSTSSSTPPISAPQASRSFKGKSPVPTNQRSHGSGSSNVLAETIEISDSDDETLRPHPARKRPRSVCNEVDIDMVEGEQRATRRRRTDEGEAVAQSVSRGFRRRGTTAGGEVIIIDD